MATPGMPSYSRAVQSLAAGTASARETGPVNPMNLSGDPPSGSALPPEIQYRMAVKAYIVEDNDLIRDNLVETLTELAGVRTVGHSATEVEACDWLGRHPGGWDLLVVDLFLEQGNGLGVLRKCLQRSASQRVVVLSNYATIDIRNRCLACGADAIFDKSTELDLFIDYCSATH
jgi:two-component system OmpR family response regulator